MVRIRLSRVGRKNLAAYRIVVTNLREKRDSKAIELIGHFSPHSKQVVINEERAKYWLSVGAQPSETVATLFVKQKLMEAPKHKRVFEKQPKKKSQDRKAKKAEKSEAAE